MGYRISYGMPENPGKKKRKGFPFLMTLICLLILFAMVSHFWPEGREMLRILLIPGDPDITLTAAEVFARELHDGISFSNAAAHFCTAILEYGYSG